MLEKIWRDSLQECKTQFEYISYEDFKLLMKGQPKDIRCRGVSYKASGGMLAPPELSESKSKALDAVPEVSAGLGHITSSPGLLEETEEDTANVLPEDKRELWGRKRSKSYEQKSTVWDQAELASGAGDDVQTPLPPALERDASRALMLPSRAGCEHTELIRDTSLSALMVNRALYRKHREMRLAVLDASKQFDKKRNEMKNNSHAAPRASLIMKRGERPPVELEDAHQRALFEAAARRCGRTRRTRNKTKSDVTGMLNEAFSVPA